MSKFEILSSTTSTVTREGLQGKELQTNWCGCSLYRAQVDGRTVHTNCYSTTARTFAPGHDARLKGFLIDLGAAEVTRVERKRAVATGEVEVTVEVRRSVKTGRESTRTTEAPLWEWVWDSTTSVQAVADGFGFHYQVANGITAARAKAAKKALRGNRRAKVSKGDHASEAAIEAAIAAGEAAAVDTQSETIHTDNQGQVKVGRWWYDQSTGETGENGGLLYISKDGSIKEAKPGAETR